jgi:hypothetical protein
MRTSALTWRRLTRLGRFASVQVAVQVLAFASGIVLVQSMTPAQYGHYTLAVAMAGLGNVLLDLGLSTAVLATGGPLHDDPARLGELAADAFALQRWLLPAGGLVLAPVFATLFLRHDIAPWAVAGLTLLVLATIAVNVRNAVGLSLVRLRGDLAVQQRLDLAVNGSKLLLVVAAVAIHLDAFIALAIAFVAAVATATVLRRYLRARLGALARPTGAHRAALLRGVRRQAPYALYYCLSAQIAVWLIGWLGSAERVAEVGALGRLSAAFAIIGATVVGVVQPYFARASAWREVVGGVLVVNAFFAVLTAALVGLALAVPGALLWVLGPHYAGLHGELVWMVLSAALSLWGGTLYGLGAARGWFVPASLAIALGIATMVVCAQALDVGTVLGCLVMNSVTAAVSLLLLLGMLARRLAAGTAAPAIVTASP